VHDDRPGRSRSPGAAGRALILVVMRRSIT
jgi:hypothetical protein